MTVLCNANALRIPLADESVHCVVTSPPYWGLRDYGIGDQLGLEATPEEYVANMVAVFREVKRVLRSDGVVFLNLGDSYAGGGMNPRPDSKYASGLKSNRPNDDRLDTPIPSGLKPKDLCGVPWRVAFALQADGWWLRSDCIWAKPNPMPESCRDRPTKSHEYIFLMTKSANYFYDQEAVRENVGENTVRRAGHLVGGTKDKVLRDNDIGQRLTFDQFIERGRNLRTVWTIATAPYSGAHFATFPPALVERCIRAGTSERGACPVCGKQWEREIKPSSEYAKFLGKGYHDHSHDTTQGQSQTKSMPRMNSTYLTVGWRPTCAHDNDPIPATVFDPFVGSGTTVAVAQQLGRRGVGIDLSLPYLHLARERTGAAAWSEWMNGKKNGKETMLEDLPMFREMR